ncbi:GNAT family N-acetyltransferase [Pseudomonas sp. 8Z]|uniref:GNAT family N-acetyltransferase n=1 Tax=Pseudomonas sp. 8Z TaxID=2653166 RepID=UPI0012F3BBFF|nr:GNAT family N-acetyltransferase [Pseudomonas sp. 8Z]VXC58050.1 GNAT family N-acetyltransferase [Pseudomonas sp. 8Z]
MPTCRLLPTPLRPLVDKFYRQHRSPMRSQGGDECWVAQDGSEIVAALNLRRAADGQWLTGLFVTPALRGQGLASTLVAQALQMHPEPIWLFCHPSLLAFYQRLGFNLCHALPAELQQRLLRYQRNKALIALRMH